MTQDLLSMTETARDFLMKSGFLIAKLDKAQKVPDSNQWRLTFDVGISHTQYKTVVVDESLGKVVGLE